MNSREREDKIIFCLFSPKTWTKLIAIVDTITRIMFIVMEAKYMIHYMNHGRVYLPPRDSISIVFLPEFGSEGDTWTRAYTMAIVRHSFGSLMALLLLVGTIKKITMFLYFWCLFALIDTVVTWTTTLSQLGEGYVYLKVVETFVILLCGYIVLTRIIEITSKEQASRERDRLEKMIKVKDHDPMDVAIAGPSFVKEFPDEEI